jgi:hypothetical protein
MSGILKKIYHAHIMKKLIANKPPAVRNTKAAVRWFILYMVIIGLGAVGYYAYTVLNSYSQLDRYYGNLQDMAAEMAATKSIGDLIVDGKKVPAGWTMKKIEQVADKNVQLLLRLDAGEKLSGYKKAVTKWTTEIREAAKFGTNGKALGDGPGEFSISLSSWKFDELMEKGINTIEELKQSGDYAILNKDREAMRYIAARILVQDRWLEGIEYSTDSGFIASNLIPTAYAYVGKPRRCMDPRCLNGNSWRYKGKTPLGSLSGSVGPASTQRTTGDIYDAANAYANGEDDGEKWDSLVDGQGNPLVKTGPLGVHEGEKIEVTWGPHVQEFMDDCSSIGGSILGTSVKTRLPSSEGGHTCNYSVNGNSCWKYITYSNQFYAGGGGNCPEANLLPQVIYEEPAPTPAAGQIKPTPKDDPAPIINPITPDPIADANFDGNYAVSLKTTCSVSGASGFNNSNTTKDTLTVSGNKLKDYEGKWYPLNSNGDVSIPINIPTMGTASGSAVSNYHFYFSNGRAMVTGKFSLKAGADEGGYAVSVNCTGTVSGAR